MYGYKGRTADAKFGKFDNALDIIDKIKNGEIRLVDVKNNQDKFKSNLSDVKKHTEVEQKSKKTLCTILKCFTKQETRLSNFLIIIL